MADGTVVIAKKDDADALDDGDPVIEKFLAFLAQDMADHPQRIRSFPANLLGRAKDLVQGMEVDLDAPLPDEDC